MGVLRSKLFTVADDATVSKLENCATGNPTEMSSHFTIGSSGPHIKKIQIALNIFKQTHRSEFSGPPTVPEFAIDGKYTLEFAQNVARYKEIKKILNFAKKIDNIVGIKTIRSLDLESQDSDVPPAPPVPAPDIPFKRRKFTRRVFTRSIRSGGDGQPDDPSKDLLNFVSDQINNFGNSTAAMGEESTNQRTIATLDESDAKPNRVQRVIRTEVRFINTGTDTMVTSETTTELKYFYGSTNERFLIVETDFRSTLEGKEHHKEFRTDRIPMEVARTDFGLIPPDP